MSTVCQNFIMSENNESKLSNISKTDNLTEMGEFWDTHSLDDYWEQTHEVDFEVRTQRRRRVTLDPQLYEQVESAARIRGVLPETLVNLWLQDRLREAGAGQNR